MATRRIRKIWATMMATSIVLSVGAYGVVTVSVLVDSYNWPTVAEWLGQAAPAPTKSQAAMPRIVPATLVTREGASGFAATLTVIRDGAAIVCQIDPADPSRVACPQTAIREN